VVSAKTTQVLKKVKMKKHESAKKKKERKKRRPHVRKE